MWLSVCRVSGTLWGLFEIKIGGSCVVLCVPLAAHADDDGVNVCATHICQFKQFVIKKVHPSSGGRERVKL